MRSSRFGDENDTFKVSPETNNWANIADQYMIQPIRGGDGRVLVREDPFKSRFDCTACNGSGHTDEVCGNCKGTKLEKTRGLGDEEVLMSCRACTVGESGARKTHGYKLCPQCNGRQGTIIVPDESQRNSTMGDILAVSKDGIQCVKVNDKVLFTNYGGQPFKFIDQDLRIIVEKDLLGLVKKLKQNVDGLTEGTFAELDNIGIAHE